MAFPYDGRRPRITVELARVVDECRGQVSFDRFIRETLEQALGAKPDGQSVSTAQGRSSEIRPGGGGFDSC